MTEIVMILPALLLLLSLFVSLFATLSLQVRCREVAASIARSIERGEEESTWQEFATNALPEAHVRITDEGVSTRIEVMHRAPLHLEVKGYAIATR